MTSRPRPAADAPPEAYMRELVDALDSGAAPTRADVQNVKLRLARKYDVKGLPTNADVLMFASADARQRLTPLLRKKPTRSLSGVSIVTVQSSPAACPHGRCTYCPGGPEWGTAQSYTGREPAALRAAQFDFDPYAQTLNRLESLSETGHPVDKIDFIIQGGTFTARDAGYQKWFVKRAFDALNAFAAREVAAAGSDSSRRGHRGAENAEPAASAPPRAPREVSGAHRPPTAPARTLEDAQRLNETARARMIGLTIETKPDWALEPHADLALDMGCTRFEIGVQTHDEATLHRVNRGHGLAEIEKSYQVTKDAGLKLNVHLMPGLPGSTFESDLEQFRLTFEDPRFRPDMLKVYPTLVIEDTPLFKQYQRGEYAPVTEDYCVRLIAEAKARYVPRWVRIQRVDRDIPTPLIEGGVKKSNLRELVIAALAEKGLSCPCIRCRESGRRPNAGDLVMRESTYESAGGVEHFVEVVHAESDTIAGFVRVREPSPDAHRPEVQDAVILRELKVFGGEVAIGAAPVDGEFQHRGLGAALTAEAERIARDTGRARVVVTAGVGVRPYYAKLGYARLGPYMAKRV